VFWTVCKGHVTDIGGPVPAGYNPDAKEIYAEGLRIPPIKIWEKGVRRRDVINLIHSNMRSRRNQEGDLNAQYGACAVGERNMIALLDKYGVETVRAAIEELKNMADTHMRSLISSIPDGQYHGEAVLEDSGHGLGDLTISADIEIKNSDVHIKITSPPQVPYFINSYAGNSMSGVLLGLMMFAQVDPPYNEGLYRCVTVDLGEHGTLCNAKEPAPHVNCTTTPMETLTDAVRMAFEDAAPDRVIASWGHASGINISGIDPKTGEQYVTMILASIISGAGATQQMDGWHACGTVWEVEPLGHEMTVVAFGEGREHPTMGAAGAEQISPELKLGRLEIIYKDGVTDLHKQNIITEIQPGDRARNTNPGGGGYGSSFVRSVPAVLKDVEERVISVAAAKTEYGVVIDPQTLAVNEAETDALRRKLTA